MADTAIADAAEQVLASRPDKAQLIDKLVAKLPEHVVLHAEEDLRPFECDGLSAYRKLPMIVVLPETIEQVQIAMQVCYANDVAVVARGAGTGLSGGALPMENGVLLSLAKFKQILDIDTANRRATVQPGVRNLAISEAVSDLGLYYAPDPSSQIACSIGGNVAENSGGVHCLKYGLTTHNIIELEIVTVEGERMTIGSEALDTPGYDLLALMTGSEGLLGVIVQVVVKLLPLPAKQSACRRGRGRASSSHARLPWWSPIMATKSCRAISQSVGRSARTGWSAISCSPKPQIGPSFGTTPPRKSRGGGLQRGSLML